eukprot:273571-Pelagomonas_calceolata.AAC.1
MRARNHTHTIHKHPPVHRAPAQTPGTPGRAHRGCPTTRYTQVHEHPPVHRAPAQTPGPPGRARIAWPTTRYQGMHGKRTCRWS